MEKRHSSHARFEGLVVPGLVLSGLCALACNGRLGGFAGSGSEGKGSTLDTLPSSDDPGFKGIHRLNSREYDSTVRDLLGTSLRPGASFLNETAFGFDNVSETLGMTSGQYSAYFRAAKEVASDVMQAPELAARVLVCTTEDDACVTSIIETFGKRAFRRPLEGPEVTTYLGVYQRATDLGLDHAQASEQLVRAFLSSAEFLYRMEFDEDPDSPLPHDVSSHELASRLSYFLWGTMPDAELWSAAEDGTLVEDDIYHTQVERMLSAPESQSLVDDFASQWLGLKALASHAVLSDVYPEWSEELRGAMLFEAALYLNDFVRGNEPWRDFLVGDFSYVNATLGEHYGVSGMSDTFDRTNLDYDGRTGFMGLGAFLTVSSFSHRTSPTLRAKWILEELLCSPPPPPPDDAVVAELEDGTDTQNEAATIENVRERLELHRSEPGCAGCHAALDPLGMALEHFDAIGQHRTTYENGDAIDPSGEMPDGTKFDGLASLAEYLSSDERFVECSTEKLMIYGLGRGPQAPDKTHVKNLVRTWEESKDPSYRGLVRAFVDSVPFRQRRGGSE